MSGDEVRIVCFGDSITASGWPSELENRLRFSWREARCWNAGVRGNTTTQALRRFDRDVAAHRPDRVILQFGFNDCNQVLNSPRPRVSPEQFRENLRMLVERVRAIGAAPLLIANHRTRMQKTLSDGQPYEVHAHRYSAITEQVAGETAARLLDLRERFPGEGLSLEEALDPDGIHLSPTGISAYAKVIAALILENPG